MGASHCQCKRRLPIDDDGTDAYAERMVQISRLKPGLIVCPGGIMKYRVAIYDLEYQIEAKSTKVPSERQLRSTPRRRQPKRADIARQIG